MRTAVTCFAPATVANVAVGFDILGFSFPAVGDRVTVERTTKRGVTIAKIVGGDGIPHDAARNTATAGLLKLLADRDLPFGFQVTIEKGIPLGSGMGGSAASAVGALVAANALLPTPLAKPELLAYALIGEGVASGSAHADNITPCLYGGLTLTRATDPMDVISLPLPKSVGCILVHPHARLDTKTARTILKSTVPLADFVHQSANLAAFVAGCFSDDTALIGRALSDCVIEPQRAGLIPGFAAAKSRALAAGALGCSISGSGPSIFAWAVGEAAADRVRGAIVGAVAESGLQCDAWIAPLSTVGAHEVR